MGSATFQTLPVGQTIWCSHRSHDQLLRNFKDPQGQVARWLEILYEYDFEVQHHPDAKHCHAYPLPRLPCKQCGLSELSEIDLLTY